MCKKTVLLSFPLKFVVKHFEQSHYLNKNHLSDITSYYQAIWVFFLSSICHFECTANNLLCFTQNKSHSVYLLLFYVTKLQLPGLGQWLKIDILISLLKQNEI